VSGSWPSDAVVVAFQKSFAEGCRIGIEVVMVEESVSGPMMEKSMPIPKTIMVYGSRGYANWATSSRTAAITQMRLSPHQGPVQVRGTSIFDPALRHSERPAPI
jgi:hypothetical protein